MCHSFHRRYWFLACIPCAACLNEDSYIPLSSSSHDRGLLLTRYQLKKVRTMLSLAGPSQAALISERKLHEKLD